jgi:hypothetical protein
MSKLAHHVLEDRMPLVVEIIIDPEVVPPMGVRCDSLQKHK